LNFIFDKTRIHRRSALWQVERAGRVAGALFEENVRSGESDPASLFSPLDPMNDEERLVADFHGTGLTVGHHPMKQHRAQLNHSGVSPAARLAVLRDACSFVAGAVIARQRPGTAKGFVFLSLEDETVSPTSSSSRNSSKKTTPLWCATLSSSSKAFCRIRTASSP
jgi:error-prone DNA polymerase